MIESEQPLVGREHELRVLAKVLDATGGPSGALMLQVAGEPGIGKSRLLRELSKQAHARGHLVLSGRAAEFEAEHPFGVFADALEDQLMARDRAQLELLADGLATELAIVLPAFEALAAGRPPELRDGRYRAFRAVRRLLSTVAADAPVALVLDDVQWADPGSVELICHLLSRPPRGAVLLALGFRSARISPQLEVALAAAVRERRACRLDLAPLS